MKTFGDIEIKMGGDPKPFTGFTAAQLQPPYKAYRYERRGILAINPRALFETFLVGDRDQSQIVEVDGCAIVDIRGPLDHHRHYWCDSYESILERVAEACATSARAVILRFDSPGGDVAGCFDAALAIRSACDAAGKQLHAFVEGECASAAYAIASQCHSITISMTSLVGSIGVLSTREDISAMNAARGLRVELIMTGGRKGDGHPEMPITEAELASTQAIVDSMGAMFFDLVASGRGLNAVALEQMQARVFHGEAAVAAGLADAVGNLSTVLALASFGGTDMTLSAKAKSKMTYEELKAVIAEAADGDDPNAKAAKRALAAMDEEPAPKDDKKEDPATAAAEPPAQTDEEKAKAKAEADAKAAAAPGTARAEGADEDKTAEAAYRIALKAQSDNAELRAQLAARDEADERTALLASRSDLTEDTAKLLAKAPIALVREHIASLAPLKGAPGGLKNPRVAALGGKPAIGKDQIAGESHLPADEKHKLDARMGLIATGTGVENTDFKLTLGGIKAS